MTALWRRLSLLWACLGLACLWLGAPALSQAAQRQTIALAPQLLGQGLENLAFLQAAAVDEANGLLYFCDGTTSRLAVMDLASQTLLKTIDTGISGGMDRGLLVNPVTGIVYITQHGSGVIWRLDPVSLAKTSFSLGAAQGEMGRSVLDPATGRIFIVQTGQGLRVLDAQLNPLATLGLQVESRALALHQGKLHLLASQGGRRLIMVADAASLEVERRIELPASQTGSPQAMAANASQVCLSLRQPAKRLLIVDKNNGSTRETPLEDNPGLVEADESRFYVLTGDPYPVGYMPEVDGAYGVIQVRDAGDGSLLASLPADYDTRFFGLSQARDLLFYAATGSSKVGLIRASDQVRLGEVQAGSALEEVAAGGAAGLIYLRDRLGGSYLHGLNPDTASLEKKLRLGGWPSKMIHDAYAGLIYVLLHYQAQVAVYDTNSGTVLRHLASQAGPCRTDALATMVLDRDNQRLLVVWPELGLLQALDLAGEGVLASVQISGLDTRNLVGAGNLHLALNPDLGLLYVFLSNEWQLNIYDSASLALQKTVTLGEVAASYPKTTQPFLHYDPGSGRLFAGPYELDPATGTRLASLPDLVKKVVGVSPDGESVYAWGLSGEENPRELVARYDRDFTTLRQVIYLRQNTSFFSSLSLDFANRRLLAADMRTAEVDIVDLEE